MDGTAAVGSETKWAKGDHVHPTDTSRAPLASPALTGTPTAPTATAGTNTTQIATTAFVTEAIATAITGSAAFQGTVSSQTTISSSNYKKGWYWVVDTAGTYVGQTCEVGDMIYAIADKASAYSDAYNKVTLEHATGAGWKHIPSGGSAGQFLGYSSSGTATWQTLSVLPTVSASDNGKVLTVVNGAWAAASLPVYDGSVLPSASGVSF